MASPHILVVDDEQDIRELLRYNLSKAGFEVSAVDSGEGALHAVRTKNPDLIILDLMLPGLDGLDCCRVLKSDPTTQHIPIVMLTARGEDSDMVTGLELGADDYVTKPFSPRVLIARVKAVLRRGEEAGRSPNAELTLGELRILPARHAVLVGDTAVDLTATQFAILHFLGRRPGWVFSRQQIISAIKGEDYPVTERSVDVQIVSLRKKLGDAGRLIETVRGVGYRIQEE
ncbi:MAG: response regulator transcription factor [bacterium]